MQTIILDPGAVVLAILTIFLTTLCQAAQFDVSWHPHPDPSVREFRIYRNGSIAATTTSSPVRIEGEPGDSITVTAFNGTESKPSEPFAAPAKAPPKRFFELQVSEDNQTWETYVLLPMEKPRWFFRWKVITVP